MKTAIEARGTYCEVKDCSHYANCYCRRCDEFTCEHHANHHILKIHNYRGGITGATK